MKTHIYLLATTMFFSSASFATYSVRTCTDLESIGKGVNYPGASHTDSWPLNGTYSLLNDIDCEGKEFDQIAPTMEAPFLGTLNGNNFTISHVTGKSGLFGFTSSSGTEHLVATFSNLKLSNFSINASRQYVGVLVDYAETVNLDNLEISDSSIFNTSDYSGLVAGYASITPHVNTTVNNSSVSGKNYVGGLFGNSEGLLSYAYVTHVDVNGVDYVGGIAGNHNASDYIGQLSVRSSTISGSNYVGGVFGKLGETYADGMNVVASDQNTISGSSYVGGIAGWSDSFSNGQVYSTSTIISVDGDYIGGLYGQVIGNSYSSIYFSGDLTAPSTALNVGRIAGLSNETFSVSASYFYDGQSFISPVEHSVGESPATFEDFSNMDWYLGPLGFNSNNWTFYSPLNPSHGPWLIK